MANIVEHIRHDHRDTSKPDLRLVAVAVQNTAHDTDVFLLLLRNSRTLLFDRLIQFAEFLPIIGRQITSQPLDANRITLAQ